MTTLLPGTRVRARGLEWEIVNVEPAGEQQRFRLRCAQGDLRGLEFDFLHPFEPIEPITREFDPVRADRLPAWRLYHQAFLLDQALGPGAFVACQPGRLQIAPYQLVPTMRALAMTRPRLLLADGVGLGKTIQAGLVLAELIARRRAHRILVVSPAGPLLEQWHREMRSRFGLRFDRIADWGALQEERRKHEMGSNPFDHLALCLTSIDFAKQEKVLQDLERATWDVVVIDEVHHCVKMGTAGDREDSLRRRLAEVLARQADGLLMLTATPHDGYDAHFASLVELLDPSLVDGRGSLRGEAYTRHVVRRLKTHVKDPVTGKELFKTREVEPRRVPMTPTSHPRFAAFQSALLALVAPRLRAAVSQRRYGDVLAFVSLLKRSVSTVLACRNTLAVIADRFDDLSRAGEEAQDARRQRLRTLRDYRQRLERYGALSFEEEQDRAALEAEDIAAEILESGADELLEKLEASKREVRREGERQKRLAQTLGGLRSLIELADRAVSEDPKLDALTAELSTIRAAEPDANVLVYTEYTDSQGVIVERLQVAIQSGALRGELLALSGTDDDAQRTKILDRFCSEDGLVLVSTDATAEGLNLHERCHHLVHFELPYNPNRLEQRNGRIDRYGQEKTPIVRYLYLAGTFEERVLLRLVSKYESQRARLTFVPNTLGVLATDDGATTVRLLEGLGEEDGRLFQSPPREIRFGEPDDDTTAPAYRELLLEVDRAISGYEKAAKSATWLAESGLHADGRVQREADRARELGRSQSDVDLLAFVCDAVAVESNSSTAVTSHADGTVTLEIPSTWTHGLEDLPGYDAATRRLRLARTAEQLRSASGEALGFLGRAHPLVRRALDRVRNVQFGGSESVLDRRVSAVHTDDAAPALLFTFVGTVHSGAGREFERVVAVRVEEAGDSVALIDPQAWLSFARLDRQIPTAGVWDRHFSRWGEARKLDAKTAASRAFDPLAQAFVELHRGDVARERGDLDDWLLLRAGELCGPIALVTGELFAGASAQPSWKTLENPKSRLAAFATDRSSPVARRREAEGVLSLHDKRSKDLERRGAIDRVDVAPIGLLLLVPSKGA
ncbi:MAG: DEAD/DEAH box helicase family protein [Planctomycetes bacterium]|nr:DEAD/DEAH box helicase family protein [Planctomycetota bacterium]